MFFLTLKKQSDFQRVKKSQSKIFSKSFIVQWCPQDSEGPNRFGLIATKRLGNAVKRNRAKRRLRELIRHEILPCCPHNHDYIFVARQGILINKFETLVSEAQTCIKYINAKR